MIRVQTQDFNPGQELAVFGQGSGAICMFVGQVRDFAGDSAVSAMTLDHYPGMTEVALAGIEAEARQRWELDGVLIIHRHGRLEAGERIVMVATSSAHRDAAFDACRFLMDWLKTKAPFWKREVTTAGAEWVAAKDEDEATLARW